ncbi:MAG: sugar transferase [Acetobacteraceae bacterium]|nr:sugar transferase [Acetobacteraceae bacterium]
MQTPRCIEVLERIPVKLRPVEIAETVDPLEMGFGSTAAITDQPRLRVHAIRAALPGRRGSTALARYLWQRRTAKKRIAIVGATAQADVLLAAMQNDDAIEILGVFDDGRRLTPGGRSAQGTIADLTDCRYAGDVDGIIVAPIPANRRDATDLVRRLLPLGAEVTACTGEASERHLDLVRLDRPPLQRGGVWVKTVLDRSIALILLVASMPVILMAMLAIVIESAGPPVFRQRRHGLGNREIDVFKLRTMTWCGSDAADGSLQTSRTDTRVTRVGAFLRRTSLDELPQLVNVLRGDMSLVGPRPLPVAMLTDGRTCSAIVPDHALRHRVKPGLTGLAQINGCRGATSTAAQVRRRFEQDIAYIENWGPFLDLCILLLTPVRLFLHRDEAF